MEMSVYLFEISIPVIILIILIYLNTSMYFKNLKKGKK